MDSSNALEQIKNTHSIHLLIGLYHIIAKNQAHNYTLP